MALETRSLHPSNLWPGRKATFGRDYMELPKQFEQLFERMSSGKAYEEIVEQTGYGLPVIKNEGQPVTFDLAGEGYKTRLTALVWALGWMVSREAIDDDQYKNQADDRSSMLAFSMRQGLELFHANVFNFAFDGTNRPIGDGQAWMSTAHPTAAGNQANRDSVGKAFSEAALEDEVIETMLVKNARGLRINTGIKRLIHPPQLTMKVTRVLKSDKQSGSANNDTNALKVLGSVPETFNYRFLTDPDAWFLQLDIKKSLMTIERDAMELTKDNDWSTESAFAKARWRGSAGPGDWRGFRGNPGPS